MNILITGGSGTVGKRLTKMLSDNGNKVFWLSRSPEKQKVKSFYWDLDKMEIDTKAFENIDTIIHLAGASVAGHKWTEEYKKEILDSRIKSTKLLVDFLNNNPTTVKHFVSASAIGIYGDTHNDLITENSPLADTFLADVCIKWEGEVNKLNPSIIKSVMRIGIVLDAKEGALVEMLKPIQFGLGAALGSGKQFISWIHVEDLCRIFLFWAENKHYSGIFNGVAPNPVTNKELTLLIAKTVNKPCFLPPVPGFMLKLILGEMADMVLSGSKVSANKIMETGFEFKFKEVEKALEDILVKK